MEHRLSTVLFQSLCFFPLMHLNDNNFYNSILRRLYFMPSWLDETRFKVSSNIAVWKGRFFVFGGMESTFNSLRFSLLLNYPLVSFLLSWLKFIFHFWLLHVTHFNLFCLQCFVSYIRSVYLMKDKEIFDVSKLPIREYAL